MSEKEVKLTEAEANYQKELGQTLIIAYNTIF